MIPTEQKLEMVVFIARKLGWTRETIGKLKPDQFVSLYNELVFQESVDIWERQYNLATLLSAIYNTIPLSRGSKTFEAKDFYDIPRPTRGGEDRKVMSEIDRQAEKIGIKLPQKREKE